MAAAKNAAVKVDAKERSWFQRWSVRALYLGVFIGVCQYLNSINVSHSQRAQL